MQEDFLINIDRLKKSGNMELNLGVSSEFLDFDEGDFHFGPQVEIQGEAYVVDDRLVLHLDLMLTAILGCKICNAETPLLVKIPNFYHIEEVKNIKSSIFDFSSVIREEIFLETPKYAECREGGCPERETLKNYFKT